MFIFLADDGTEVKLRSAYSFVDVSLCAESGCTFIHTLAFVDTWSCKQLKYFVK